MNEASLTISFADRQEITNPYWLRMELVEEDDGQMTVGEAADFIDALYNTSICGEAEVVEVEDENIPDATDWDSAFATLRNLPTCEAYEALSDVEVDSGAYDVQIKVYRSHQKELYKLILSNGNASIPIRKEEGVILTLNIENQTHIALDTPIVKNPVITWTDIDGPDINIKGNTLWWEGEVTGTLRAEFDTIYDLIDIHVTGLATEMEIITGTEDSQWLGSGWYSGSETGEELTDVQGIECQCLAFYHYQYEELLLTKPEIDESVSDTEIEAVCSYAASMHIVEEDEPFKPDEWSVKACEEECANRYASGSDGFNSCIDNCNRTCFKRVDYDAYCTCGGKYQGTLTYQYPTPCPDDYNTGSIVGENEEGGDKFVDCGADNVYRGWFYEQKCCYPWPFENESLPHCEKKYEPFTGQGLNEEQTADFKQKYGDDVNIIMVGPIDSHCGETITTQNIQQRNCCDNISQIYWDYENSVEVIADDSFGDVFITGGQTPYTWQVRGNGFAFDAAGTVRDAITAEPFIRIFTNDSCGNAAVYVTDGCSSVSNSIRSTEGSWNFIGLFRTNYSRIITEFPDTYDCVTNAYGWSTGIPLFQLKGKYVISGQYVNPMLSQGDTYSAGSGRVCSAFDLSAADYVDPILGIFTIKGLTGSNHAVADYFRIFSYSSPALNSNLYIHEWGC